MENSDTSFPDPWQFNPDALSPSESPWRSGPPSAPAHSSLQSSPAPIRMPQQSTPVSEAVYALATNVSNQPTPSPVGPSLVSSYPPPLVDPDPIDTIADDETPHFQQPHADQSTSQRLADGSTEQTLESAWWLVESWYTLAAPSGAEEHEGLAGFNDRDRWRKGRLLALVLLVLSLGSLLATLIFLVQLVAAPGRSTLASAGVAIMCLLCAALLVGVNRGGHVALAGVLTGALVSILLLVTIVSESTAGHGSSWANSPVLDFLVLGPLIIALSAKPWQAGLALLLDGFLMVVLVLLLPHQSSQTAIRHDLNALFPPLLLSVAATFLGIISNIGMMPNERDWPGGHVHGPPQVARVLSDQAQSEQQYLAWVREVIVRLDTALKRGWRFVPPDVPPEAEGNVLLLDIRQLLANLANRVYPLQLVDTDIKRRIRHLQQFPGSIQMQRLDKVQADEEIGLDELEQIAVLPGGALSPEVESLLVEERKVLRQASNEDLQFQQAAKEVMKAWMRGDLRRRINSQLIPPRVGELVLTINMLLANFRSQLEGSLLRKTEEPDG